jgi:hypothetical protein
MSTIERQKIGTGPWSTVVADGGGGGGGGGSDPLLPALGLLAETMPEWGGTGGNTLTPQRLQGGLVWLEAGVPVTGLVIPMSDVGGVSAGSRFYSTLYSVAGDLLAVSLDLAHNGWPVAPGSFLAPFTEPYDPPASGAYIAAAYEGNVFNGGEPLFVFPSFGAGIDFGVPGATPRMVKCDTGLSFADPPPAAAVFVGDDSYLRLGVY